MKTCDIYDVVHPGRLSRSPIVVALVPPHRRHPFLLSPVSSGSFRYANDGVYPEGFFFQPRSMRICQRLSTVDCACHSNVVLLATASFSHLQNSYRVTRCPLSQNVKVVSGPGGSHCSAKEEEASHECGMLPLILPNPRAALHRKPQTTETRARAMESAIVPSPPNRQPDAP